MDDASNSATLLLERSERSVDVDVLEDDCGDASTLIESTRLPAPTEDVTGLGHIFRAPGLVLLATVFLVEGYTRLGVLPVGHSSAASLVSGGFSLFLVSVFAPLAAVVLTRGRRVTSWALQELVIGVVVAVMVATIAALVVGGPEWRMVAGISDLVLAASVLGGVLLEERARLLSSDTREARRDRESPSSGSVRSSS